MIYASFNIYNSIPLMIEVLFSQANYTKFILKLHSKKSLRNLLNFHMQIKNI